MEFKYKRFKEEFNYLKVLIPSDAFDYMDIEVNGETYEGIDKLFEVYPEIKEDDCLKLLIDINTGHVVNWPLDYPFEFYDFKIVDDGVYILMKDQTESENDLRYEGYVPGCIGEGGYGDYLEFEIDNNGDIPDWDFDNEDYKEFLDAQDDWDEDDD